MIIVDSVLKNRELSQNPIKVGIAGIGQMGKGIINQITKHTPGISIVAIYHRNPSILQSFLTQIGLNFEIFGDNLPSSDLKFLNQKTILTSNLDLFCSLEFVDIIIDATGAVEFGAELALKTFGNGKNLLSLNAELDSTLGPILLHKSKEKNVRYSLSDGDQPGVTMNLYRHVKLMGFEPLVCGNIKGLQDHYRTPKTQEGFAAKWNMNPYMATSFADGTKISFEQSCIANATGMKIATRGMYGFQAQDHVDDLTHLFDIDQLKSLGGIVDYFIGASPAPGIFIYASTNDPFTVKTLSYEKMGNGPLYSFYVPYHLLFFEIASSVCRLQDFNDPVIIPKKGPVVDVVTAAKTDLLPGDKLDDIGGFKTFGLCENHSVAMAEKLLPMGIAAGCTLVNPIARDQLITYDDVEIPPGRLIDKLIKEQIELFN